mmetsp:Transcript_45225/g.50691  ORF Transcript_45225/g.50691 Transcript_45225/m.50691 type:complete len:300 (-) Transcript_45225:331-1230(-)
MFRLTLFRKTFVGGCKSSFGSSLLYILSIFVCILESVQQSLMPEAPTLLPSIPLPVIISSAPFSSSICWLITVKKLSLNTTFPFASFKSLPVSPLLSLPTLSICFNCSIASISSSCRPTTFSSAFLALRITRFGPSNSIPKTDTPPATNTSPNGGGKGIKTSPTPRPSIVPPPTAMPALLARRIHRCVRVGPQCSWASVGFNTNIFIVKRDSKSKAVASLGVLFVQGIPFMAKTKSPGLKAECAKRPSDSILSICNNFVIVTSCVPDRSPQSSFCVVLCSMTLKVIPDNVLRVGFRQNA